MECGVYNNTDQRNTFGYEFQIASCRELIIQTRVSKNNYGVYVENSTFI